MKSACGPRFMRALLPTGADLRLHQIRMRAHAPAQDLVAHGGEMQREEQQREGHAP